ncbi:hypothetical protein ABID99_003475 [Mucilaginibacter sp. OAE612]|uniref:hypothetical protein n=1 Tax=Mucilaginibacter sp. OAE612 TaxID=3156444 RepID=UPI00359EC7D4
MKLVFNPCQFAQNSSLRFPFREDLKKDFLLIGVCLHRSADGELFFLMEAIPRFPLPEFVNVYAMERIMMKNTRKYGVINFSILAPVNELLPIAKIIP